MNQDDVWQLAEELRKDMGKKVASILCRRARSFWQQGNLEEMYEFFSQVYDEVYHDMIFKKMDVHVSTRAILEILATPIYRKEKSEQEKILAELLK